MNQVQNCFKDFENNERNDAIFISREFDSWIWKVNKANFLRFPSVHCRRKVRPEVVEAVWPRLEVVEAVKALGEVEEAVEAVKDPLEFVLALTDFDEAAEAVKALPEFVEAAEAAEVPLEVVKALEAKRR